MRRSSNASITMEDLTNLQNKINDVDKKLVYFADKTKDTKSPDIISLLEKCIVHMGSMDARIKYLEENKKSIERDVFKLNQENEIQRVQLQELQKYLQLDSKLGKGRENLGKLFPVDSRDKSKVAKEILNFENSSYKISRTQSNQASKNETPAQGIEAIEFSKSTEKSSRVSQVLNEVIIREPLLIIHEDDNRLKGCNKLLSETSLNTIKKSLLIDMVDENLQRKPPIDTLIKIQDILLQEGITYEDWSSYLSRHCRGKLSSAYLQKKSKKLEPWSSFIYNFYKYVDFKELDKSKTKELLKLRPKDNESVKSYFLRLLMTSETITTIYTIPIVHYKIIKTYYNNESLYKYNINEIDTFEDMIDFAMNIDDKIIMKTRTKKSKKHATKETSVFKENPKQKQNHNALNGQHPSIFDTKNSIKTIEPISTVIPPHSKPHLADNKQNQRQNQRRTYQERIQTKGLDPSKDSNNNPRPKLKSKKVGQDNISSQQQSQSKDLK